MKEGVCVCMILAIDEKCVNCSFSEAINELSHCKTLSVKE